MGRRGNAPGRGGGAGQQGGVLAFLAMKVGASLGVVARARTTSANDRRLARTCGGGRGGGNGGWWREARERRALAASSAGALGAEAQGRSAAAAASLAAAPACCSEGHGRSPAPPPAHLIVDLGDDLHRHARRLEGHVEPRRVLGVGPAGGGGTRVGVGHAGAAGVWWQATQTLVNSPSLDWRRPCASPQALLPRCGGACLPACPKWCAPLQAVVPTLRAAHACMPDPAAHLSRRYQAASVRMEMSSMSQLHSTIHSRIWDRNRRIAPSGATKVSPAAGAAGAASSSAAAAALLPPALLPPAAAALLLPPAAVWAASASSAFFSCSVPRSWPPAGQGPGQAVAS